MSRIYLQNAAQVLLIWQMVIVDGGDRGNLRRWHRFIKSAFNRADHRHRRGWRWKHAKWTICGRSACAFQLRYNAFSAGEGVLAALILFTIVNKDEMN